MIVIAYPAGPSARNGLFSLPRAEIRIAPHSDGRWMWAISYATKTGGYGFAPLPKWGHFADSPDAAQAQAAAHLRLQITRRSGEAETTCGRNLLEWLDSLEAPQQIDLFGEAA
ncbi:MAG: hypothetical protein ABF296_07500 [Oceanococcaceae bacterium]